MYHTNIFWNFYKFNNLKQFSVCTFWRTCFIVCSPQINTLWTSICEIKHLRCCVGGRHICVSRSTSGQMLYLFWSVSSFSFVYKDDATVSIYPFPLWLPAPPGLKGCKNILQFALLYFITKSGRWCTLWLRGKIFLYLKLIFLHN